MNYGIDEGVDYTAVHLIGMVNSTQWCVQVHINNDNWPELEESFTLKFSEVDGDSAGVGCSDVSSTASVGSGSGDFMISNTTSLQPMFNETTIITIKDDDLIRK